MKFVILLESRLEMCLPPPCVLIYDLRVCHSPGFGGDAASHTPLQKLGSSKSVTSEGKQWVIRNIFEWKRQFKILSIKHTYTAYLQSKFTLDSWYLWKFFLLYLLKITTVYIRNKLKQLR